MNSLLRWSLLLCLIAPPSVLQADQIQLGLRVPDGFEVVEFADSTLANDIYCLTIDPRGRIVVSGRGYIRILTDENHDGKADGAIEFAAGPKDGAQGLLWESRTLYVTGDGGLRRYTDNNSDDRADGPSTLIRAMKTGGEHDAHAIRRGPDGWLYLLCGNSAGIDGKFAQLPTTPIRTPIAGCVLRFTPDLQSSEIVADGFRNPYGMDFNLDGELFAFDSDNERCVSLPWYEPTRFYHVIPGGHHGWCSPQRGQFWRQPPYFYDVVEPVAYVGRGSPTGVTCYRHNTFPAKYHGGVFLLDWTFGKIHFVSLKRHGASYRGRPEVFLESVGENGFAPTAAAVHPQTGDLYIAIGGRGTRGAVYRISSQSKPNNTTKETPLPAVSLDWRLEDSEDMLRRAGDARPWQRLRALSALQRHHKHFPSHALMNVVRKQWTHDDRYVRQAAARLIAALDNDSQASLSKLATTPAALSTYGLGALNRDRDTTLTRACELLGATTMDGESRLLLVRLLQLCLGDIGADSATGTVWEGYSRRTAPLTAQAQERVCKVLRRLYPTLNANVDREIARTLALLADNDAATLKALADRITADSQPVDDIHHLIVSARLTGPRSREFTQIVAQAFLALDRKLDAQHARRDRNWPLRILETYAELARHDTLMHEALINHKDFGRPDHALFTRAAGFPKREAAELFLAHAEKAPDYAWNADLIRLVAALPDQRSLPIVRRLWGQAGLDDVILPILAKRAAAEDRDKFLEGLSSPQFALARACLEALERLPKRNDGNDLFAVVKALRSLADGREEKQLRDLIVRYLEKLTGQKHGSDKQAWTDWYTKAYPAFAKRLGGADGVDVEGWNKRLALLRWDDGDSARGQSAYLRANCASCHSGSQALGPDLRGVANRFSRADLFTSILQPSKDISPRYRTTAIETADGKTYEGMIIYEAVDSLILQSGPTATVRVVNHQIVGRRFTQTSLMPTGLLDKLSNQEITDLYAYLRSLSK